MNQEEYKERKLDKMRKLSREFAKAKADRVKLDHFRKSKLAILMKEYSYDHKTTSAQEREARADEDYLQVLQAIHEAVLKKEETLKFELRFFEMEFEKWRTLEATKRAEINKY